jgi:hypothetical protein
MWSSSVQRGRRKLGPKISTDLTTFFLNPDTENEKVKYLLENETMLHCSNTVHEAFSDRLPNFWTREGSPVGELLRMSGLMRAFHMRLNQRYPCTAELGDQFR